MRNEIAPWVTPAIRIILIREMLPVKKARVVIYRRLRGDGKLNWLLAHAE